MKKFKQIFALALVCCLILAIAPTVAMATKPDWEMAYLNFIQEDTENDVNLRDSAEYHLIYIDNDDIPELYINYIFGYAGGKICTFDGQKVKFVYTSALGGISYLEKEGLIYTSGGSMDSYWDKVYMLYDGNFEEIASGTTSVRSWDPYIVLCTWNGEDIPESQYKEKLENLFDFTNALKISYDETYNTYDYVGIYMVLDRIDSILLNKYSMVLEVGDQDRLSIITDIGGSAAKFESNNTSVATVDAATGIVTAVGEGTAIITAIEQGWGNTASCIVTVERISMDKGLFTDIPSTVYYYDAVQWAVDHRITSGTSNTTFSPETSCTRAQTVTFLYRAAGSPTVNVSNPFMDVTESDYYYDAVLWAVKNGIAQGTTVTTFSPNKECTRAEAVTFLHRANNSPAVSGTNRFKDVTSDSWYANAVQWAVNTGVTAGTSATTFSPDQNCIRAQIVTFLYRDREGGLA